MPFEGVELGGGLERSAGEFLGSGAENRDFRAVGGADDNADEESENDVLFIHVERLSWVRFERVSPQRLPATFPTGRKRTGTDQTGLDLTQPDKEKGPA